MIHFSSIANNKGVQFTANTLDMQQFSWLAPAVNGVIYALAVIAVCFHHHKDSDPPA